MSLQAIVLAGGLGTRLRSVVADTPKVMAPIAGRPFLEYVLTDLDRHGFRSVILAVGYKKEMVMSHFGDSFLGLSLIYSEERELLGTGGAVRQALALAGTGPCFVLNGDTWVDLDYKEMLDVHLRRHAGLTIALRQVSDVGRFGAVEIEDGRVTKFCEKGRVGAGFINAGVYLLTSNTFSGYALPTAFSLEREFFAPNIKTLAPLAFVGDGQFIDIGVPEEYQRAQEILASIGKGLP
jgi:D-glycero-alpha-D-manno-heptose 1-phosphate guanylyltransferase